MSATNVFDTFQDAYVAQLRRVRDEPEFVNAPRGFRSREVLGVSYRVVDPRERAVRIRSRRSNIVFNFAEALWYLGGGDSLEAIAFYAPSMRKYSVDGRTLRGTAYGPRIFGYGRDRIDQWRSVVDTLAEDRDSKRAMIQIFSPEELLVPGNIDVACTIGLQYLIRDGRLHAVSFMRANDAFRGSVSDVFSFTFLQEVLANELGLDLGSYTHVAGSYHLYESDDDRANHVLDCADDVVSQDPFPRMPAGDNWPAIREVQAVEAALRTGRSTVDRGDIERLGLDEYWQQVVALLALHASARAGAPFDLDVFEMLPPLYASMFANVWPVPATVTT